MKNFKSDQILVRALIGLALAQELDQWLKGRLFVLQPTMLASISILIAVMVITMRKRWVPIIPIVFSALNFLVAFKSPFEKYHLTHPFTLAFVAAVIELIAMLGTFVAAINAIIQNYKLKG
jgi:hypothetical protein